MFITHVSLTAGHPGVKKTPRANRQQRTEKVLHKFDSACTKVPETESLVYVATGLSAAPLSPGVMAVHPHRCRHRRSHLFREPAVLAFSAGRLAGIHLESPRKAAACLKPTKQSRLENRLTVVPILYRVPTGAPPSLSWRIGSQTRPASCRRINRRARNCSQTVSGTCMGFLRPSYRDPEFVRAVWILSGTTTDPAAPLSVGPSEKGRADRENRASAEAGAAGKWGVLSWRAGSVSHDSAVHEFTQASPSSIGTPSGGTTFRSCQSTRGSSSKALQEAQDG